MRQRILVVDDEPGMLRAVQRILDGEYVVETAGSAAEALAVVDAFDPDLALLDIRMPGQDGFELMERLKTARPDLDVILMTGSTDETGEKMLRAIQQKAFYFIQKPFDRQILRTLIGRCLELRRLEFENRGQLRRLERVLEEARAFQRSLLPASSARFGRIDIAARYLPVEALCGDLYDYAVYGEEAVAFIVADVSGHGASAAMLTGVVKSAFRSCSRDGFLPQAVVERISQGIRSFNANRYVTLICGRLDLRQGRLDYINAGHPPALLWGPDGRWETLGSSGLFISPAFDGISWDEQVVSFGVEDRLLLYTDGVTEAPSATEQFGNERLAQSVQARPAGGPELLDGILGDIREFMGGRQPDDDLTLMTLAGVTS
jgi:sigma-B regulation protein RsbU (phosphoserine phosphatase)